MLPPGTIAPLHETLHPYLQMIGRLGCATYVANFFLLVRGRLHVHRVLFPALRCVAARCVLASLITAFNLAAAMTQICFLLIGIHGISARLRIPSNQVPA